MGERIHKKYTMFKIGKREHAFLKELYQAKQITLNEAISIFETTKKIGHEDMLRLIQGLIRKQLIISQEIEDPGNTTQKNILKYIKQEIIIEYNKDLIQLLVILENWFKLDFKKRMKKEKQHDSNHIHKPRIYKYGGFQIGIKKNLVTINVQVLYNYNLIKSLTYDIDKKQREILIEQKAKIKSGEYNNLITSQINLKMINE